MSLSVIGAKLFVSGTVFILNLLYGRRCFGIFASVPSGKRFIEGPSYEYVHVLFCSSCHAMTGPGWYTVVGLLDNRSFGDWIRAERAWAFCFRLYSFPVVGEPLPAPKPRRMQLNKMLFITRMGAKIIVVTMPKIVLALLPEGSLVFLLIVSEREAILAAILQNGAKLEKWGSIYPITSLLESRWSMVTPAVFANSVANNVQFCVIALYRTFFSLMELSSFNI